MATKITRNPRYKRIVWSDGSEINTSFVTVGHYMCGNLNLLQGLIIDCNVMKREFIFLK